MSLPGVKVGPLDPETTADFGHVSQGHSARTLIRLHSRMYPPALRRQLARPRDNERSEGLDLDEVRGYVGGLAHENGDPYVPEGAQVVGAAVAGDEATGRVLRFQYQLPSGRVGKWFAPYSEEHLPTSFHQGAERARVKAMKDRGVVSIDEGATDAELLRRRLAASQAENERLRAQQEGREPSGEETPGKVPGAAGQDAQAAATQNEELEQLRRANKELTERNATLEQFAAAQTGAGGGAVPTGGLEDDIPDRNAQAQAQAEGVEGDDMPDERTAAQEPPHEGYDELKAGDVVARIKDEETSDEAVAEILAYERTHANRATVTAAAEQRLDRSRG